ncbi:sulfite exporter TauE/SafE family protein [Haloterrigena alkaliphila]|uniref:Sulfite exporter TauE/SafE family protein n=1 Tax=Haloterrigena alkaliphila TaxID=2816475 RepID=A0A8A2VL56_9EURY|nr:sulfite exporter TauE/SafE family protein [Haloterrigena alkaliphila]QSX01053.1 sulfite exporter TauE/SafE family protein [Haloterrigena alkaliphila]
MTAMALASSPFAVIAFPGLDRLVADATLASAAGPGIGFEHADLLVLFVVGLLAGAHCLGMCGPLVTTYADRIGAASDKRRDDTLTAYEVRQHALFNLGRTASYAVLGGFFGLLGAATVASSEAIAAVGDPVRGATGILVGIAIVASGLYYVRGRTAVPGHDLPVVGALFRRLSGALSSRIDRLATSPGIAALGAVHGFMPCPIIYPAYLYAFAVGSPTRGALSLAVLGLGTIPTLFAYGTVLTSLEATTRVRLHRGLGVAFVVLGSVPLSHGLLLYGIQLPHLPLPFVPLS